MCQKCTEHKYACVWVLLSEQLPTPPLALPPASQSADYASASSHLKSSRQDLTVQHVSGRLAVRVYETHARIALESSDWAEFKQCHASLRRLWESGAPEAVPVRAGW